MVAQIESEGHYPQADYAFDNGVLSLPLTQQIESAGKHWVSEIERSRLNEETRRKQRGIGSLNPTRFAACFAQQHPTDAVSQDAASGGESDPSRN